MAVQLFTSPINRPQSESGKEVAFLEVTQGCSHNLCRFCVIFKHVAFRAATPEELDKRFEYLKLCDNMNHYKRIFLQAANPFHLSYDELAALGERIHRELPDVETIGCYARVTDIADKTSAQLRSLKDLGYAGLDIGIESADDDILRTIKKGVNSANMREQLGKLNEAGITWTGNYMLGVGGAGAGERSARATASLFNEVPPTNVGVLSTTLFSTPDGALETPLCRDVKKGRYEPAGETERLEEYALFLENLTAHVTLDGTHITNPLLIRGILPDQKDLIIQGIKDFIGETSEQRLTTWRRMFVARASQEVANAETSQRTN